MSTSMAEEPVMRPRCTGHGGRGGAHVEQALMPGSIRSAGRVERHRAAPDAPDTALRLQGVEVAADCHRRDAEFPAQFGHAGEGTLRDEGAHALLRSAAPACWMSLATTPSSQGTLTCQIERHLAFDLESRLLFRHDWDDRQAGARSRGRA